MKERPILFSTEMVQAIMNGTKTQTRRVVKKTPETTLADDGVEMKFVNCPYGKKGDVLWVRESWRPIGWDSDRFGVQVQFEDESTISDFLFDDPDKDLDFEMKCSDILHDKGVDYDTELPNGIEGWTSELIQKHMPWRPSIHMPKAAARIWLLVEDVQVQRLQDISEDDVKAEGIHAYTSPMKEGVTEYRDYLESDWNESCDGWTDPRLSFMSLWDSINFTSYPWVSNPWVWVVKFKVLSTDGKPDNLQELVGFNRMKKAFNEKGRSRTTEKA